jgi:hypothetical protein
MSSVDANRAVFGCEVPILERAGSQQRRFQFKECAQQFVRMDNGAATFAMRVNNPTPAVRYDGATITPRKSAPKQRCRLKRNY